MRPSSTDEARRVRSDRTERKPSSVDAGPAHGRGPLTGGKDSDYVESLERGIRVLRAFDAAHSSMTLSEVADRANITRAAARRYLHTLSALGYAAFDGKRFELTARVLEFGFSYLRALGLPEIVRPYLERVSAALGESASVAVLDGRDIVYIARVSTRRIMSVDLGVGARLPAVATSMGRVLLASLPARERDEHLGADPLTAYTRHTVTSKIRLRNLLRSVHQRGYSLVDEELEDGLRSIAVPIVDSHGRVIAAMNLSAQANRVGLDVMKRAFLAALRQAADEIRHHPELPRVSVPSWSRGTGAPLELPAALRAPR